MNIETTITNGPELAKWIDMQITGLKGILDISYATLIVPSNKVAREYTEAVDGKPHTYFIEVLVRPTNKVTLRLPE